MAPIYEPTAIKKKVHMWSDLMQDLVEKILMRLPLEHFFHAGLVCKSWGSAMINVRRLFKPPPLLILKPVKHCGRVRWAEAIRFYTLCGGGRLRRLSIRLDSSNNNPGGMATSCHGSSMGWLLMADMDDESRVHLLNPISGVKVELPPLPRLFILPRSAYVLCSTSAPDRDIIVAIHVTWFDGGLLRLPRLLTCRPRDGRWGELPFNTWEYSAALYDGRLYVSDRHGTDIYDLDPDPRKICSITLDDACIKKRGELVVMDGKLLLVPAGTRHSVCEFVDSRWVKIQRPRDWVLLRNQGKTQAFSVKESLTWGLEANCIYYADGFVRAYSMEDERCCDISPTSEDFLSYPFLGMWSKSSGFYPNPGNHKDVFVTRACTPKDQFSCL